MFLYSGALTIRMSVSRMIGQRPCAEAGPAIAANFGSFWVARLPDSGRLGANQAAQDHADRHQRDQEVQMVPDREFRPQRYYGANATPVYHFVKFPRLTTLRYFIARGDALWFGLARWGLTQEAIRNDRTREMQNLWRRKTQPSRDAQRKPIPAKGCSASSLS